MIDSDWTRPSFSSAGWILADSWGRFWRRVTVTSALKMSFCYFTSSVIELLTLLLRSYHLRMISCSFKHYSCTYIELVQNIHLIKGHGQIIQHYISIEINVASPPVAINKKIITTDWNKISRKLFILFSVTPKKAFLVWGEFNIQFWKGNIIILL